jgi:hypothetical protein
VLRDPDVHHHDVVERIPQDVEALAERRRNDLAEEDLDADPPGRRSLRRLTPK